MDSQNKEIKILNEVMMKWYEQAQARVKRLAPLIIPDSSKKILCGGVTLYWHEAFDIDSLIPFAILRANQRFSLMTQKIKCWNVQIVKSDDSLCLIKIKDTIEQIGLSGYKTSLAIETKMAFLYYELDKIVKQNLNNNIIDISKTVVEMREHFSSYNEHDLIHYKDLPS